MSKLPAQPNRSIIDGMEILQELATTKEPVSCSFLAQKLNMEKTRVNRILKTLAFAGFAYQDKNRHYTGGPGMHVLAARSLHGSGLIQNSIKHLIKLTEHHFVVALGVLWRDQVSYLYHHIPGTDPLEGIGRLALHPAIGSSIGMIMMSEKNEPELEQLFTEPPENFPDFKSFIAELKKIRKQNYVLLEPGPNHRSLAVKLGNPAYAAIALSGNIPSDKVSYFLKILRETAQKIDKDSL
jgi:DNA-binding IclR family transcriptional regulator